MRALYRCAGGAGTPARPNRGHASASRIWEGSLYIDLRLTHVIPARRPASPEASSRLIFHDLLRRAQGPVAAVDEGEVRRAERDTLGARAGNVLKAGRVGTPYVQPRARAALRLCAWAPFGRRREARNVEHVHAGGEELVLGVRCLSSSHPCAYSLDALANRQVRRHRGRRGYLVGDSRGRPDTPVGADMARAICDSPRL